MTKWPMVPLGEVLFQDTNYIDTPEAKSYPKLSVKLYGKGVILDAPADGSTLKMQRHQIAKAGQVILSEIWGKKGAIGLVPDEGNGALCTSHFFLFNIRTNRLLPQWLNYIFNGNYLEVQLNAEAHGTTGYAAVRPKTLLAATIPLPPLPEQERLVEYLDALSSKIAEATILRNQADSASAALLTAVIGQGLEAVPFKGTLSEVLRDRPRNGWSPNCDGLETGTAVLSLGAVTGFSYRRDKFKWTSEATNNTGHYWLAPGDLLITRSNTPELVGHAAIYDGHPAPCIYSDLMMKLDVDDDKADRQFVHLILQSRLVRDFIKANAKGTSPTMKKISQGVVMAIPFPTQLGRMEQQRIREQILHSRSKLLTMKELQANGGRELGAMMPGILAQVFGGDAI